MTHDNVDAPTPTAAAGVGRRWVLSGGLGVAAAVALAGCGDDGGTTAAPPAATDTESEKGAPEEPAGGGGTELGPASDVAVGSGVIYAAEKVVVTQPTEGEFRAFDTTCTHAGCPVDTVTETINCPCHGSAFAIEDGSVVNGPASEPLAAKDVTVEGGTITLA